MHWDLGNIFLSWSSFPTIIILLILFISFLFPPQTIWSSQNPNRVFRIHDALVLSSLFLRVGVQNLQRFESAATCFLEFYLFYLYCTFCPSSSASFIFSIPWPYHFILRTHLHQGFSKLDPLCVEFRSRSFLFMFFYYPIFLL